jgi:uncharacterized protein
MVAFNVAQLLKASTGETRTFDFDELPEGLGPDVVLAAPLRGHARLMRTLGGILVQGDFDAQVRVECARCLGDTILPIHGEIEEEAQPSVDLRSGDWIPEQQGDEETLRIDDRHILELDDIIRQEIVASLPLQPLCRADCNGLCEVCGANLNETACGHPQRVAVEEAEPPLGRLGELLEQQLKRTSKGD